MSLSDWRVVLVSNCVVGIVDELCCVDDWLCSLGGCGIALAFVEGIILICEICFVYAEHNLLTASGQQPRLGGMLKSTGRASHGDAGNASVLCSIIVLWVLVV